MENSCFLLADFTFESPPEGDQKGSVGVLICKQNLTLILAILNKSGFI